MDLTVTPREGRWYRVPCVRAFYGSDQYLQWWPVIGPGHSDREILNFPTEHFHVDYRFLSNRKLRVLRSYWDENRSAPSPSGTGADTVFIFPICAHQIHPTIRRAVDVPYRWRADHFKPDLLADVSGKREDWFQRRRMLCTSPAFPRYSLRAPWHPALEDAYEHHRLGAHRICPHRQADLSSIDPVAGIITCPLHGLRWWSDSGRLARHTHKERKQ